MKRYKHVANGIKEEQASSLREVTARNMLGDLPAQSEEEYDEYVKNLSLADLQSHAPTMGVKPVGDRKRLEKTLKMAFRDKLRTYGAALAKAQKTKAGSPARPRNDELTKRLREHAKRFK